MRYLPVFLILLSVYACTKKDGGNPSSLPFSEQVYTMEITNKWTSQYFNAPATAHFTNFIGLIHGKDTFMWKPGILANKGMENMAENGSNGVLYANLAAIVASKKALSRFGFTPPAINSVKTDTIKVNTDNSYISLGSMIAPSPDWFTGMHDYNLVQSGKWIDDVTVDIFAYDAGTEDGNAFTYDNPVSDPQQFITLIEPKQKTILFKNLFVQKPIASIRFRRLTP